MARAAYDPFKDESLISPPPPPGSQGPKKTRIRIDWKRGAQMLARGERADAVAAALGISEDRLWKHFHKSLRFQFLFRVALERDRAAAQLRFEAESRRATIERCGSEDGIDPMSWQWLAGQAGLAQEMPAQKMPSQGEASGQEEEPGKRELRLVAALKSIGREPPNQALRERIKKERKVMDAQFAELKAWGRVNGILPPEGQDKTQTSTNKSEISTDKTQISTDKSRISENKTQISGNKIEISANKTEISKAEPPKAAASPQERPSAVDESEPLLKTPPIMPRHLLGSVTDLTDGDGVPLSGNARDARG